ncbi:MAG: ABC transporter permease [Erysipelotrichaceae bacterium]|nr:ABC transporter permease [Erysipelotrichaceae bacterium]
MKLYLKLSLDGIRKNYRLYIPYILTGTLVIMMFYVLLYLSSSKSLWSMPAATFLAAVLPLGIVVIAVFSVLFLFYTNSFLIKTRAREFGLYNILGMNRHNLSILLFFENAIVFIAALLSGLMFGVAFSKMGELILFKLAEAEADYSLNISYFSLIITALCYLAIYALLFLNSLIKVAKLKPIELLNSSKQGEKRPKGNIILALLGLIILLMAYFLAVYYSGSFTAVFTFFIAVILVIIATYLLFIAGSVTLCGILKNNKSYYYKSNHFISISSLAYRMKRNGAGLASICILLTMILVMISSTSSLYFALDDSINKRYPGDINYTLFYRNYDYMIEDNQLVYTDNLVCENISTIKYLESGGCFTEYGMNNAPVQGYEDASTALDIGYLYTISLDEYNRLSNQIITLQDDECLLYTNSRIRYSYETFKTAYSKEYRVKNYVDEFINNHAIYDYEMPCMILIVSDLEGFYKDNNTITEQGNVVYCKSSTDFDVIEDFDETLENLRQNLSVISEEKVYNRYITSLPDQRSNMLGLFSSMLFLGIMLSFVFILATVLIIYYKQTSEGYEDSERFAIMRKVGLEDGQIRKSINSQMLTVFFCPLIMAGIHLCFAFPFVWSMLNMFGFSNLRLMIIVTAVCYVACAVLYVIIYLFTSRTYYKIVANE